MLKVLSNFSVLLRSFQILADPFRSLQILQNTSNSFQFFQILSEFSKFFEIPQNSLRLSQAPSDSFQFFPNFPMSFRIPQILQDSGSLKFVQILSEFSNFSQILPILQVPPDSFKFLHFLSDPLLQILLSFFRCLQRHGQESSRFFKIFQFYLADFRSSQILSGPCRFFKILPNCSSFLHSLRIF